MTTGGQAASQQKVLLAAMLYIDAKLGNVILTFLRDASFLEAFLRAQPKDQEVMMPSTTDFIGWLENGNAPESSEDAYDLHLAVNGASSGAYDVTGDSNKLFIKGPDGTTLCLLSPAAINSFSRLVDGFKSDPEMPWDAWIHFTRAMAKDD